MIEQGRMAGDPRFRYALVWTPLPLITCAREKQRVKLIILLFRWLLPFIGHIGIATSTGVITDFQGPYHVGVGDMMLGPPARYWQLDTSKIRGEEWDSAVMQGKDVYNKRMVRLF